MPVYPSLQSSLLKWSLKTGLTVSPKKIYFPTSKKVRIKLTDQKGFSRAYLCFLNSYFIFKSHLVVTK